MHLLPTTMGSPFPLRTYLTVTKITTTIHQSTKPRIPLGLRLSLSTVLNPLVNRKIRLLTSGIFLRRLIISQSAKNAGRFSVHLVISLIHRSLSEAHETLTPPSGKQVNSSSIQENAQLQRSGATLKSSTWSNTRR